MNRVEFSAPDPRYKKKSGLKQALVETPLVWLLSALTKPSRKTIDAALSKNAPSILIIRHNAIGDAVVSSVMIAALRKQYPESPIAVLASSRNAEAFKWINGVSEVHVWPQSGRDRLEVIKQLRGRFDLIFQTLFDENFNSRTLSARLVANLGVLIGPRRSTPADRLYEYTVELPLGSYVGKLLSLLEPLGAAPVPVLIEQFPRYELSLPQAFTDQARDFLVQHGLHEQDYVLLNLSAGAPNRSLDTRQAADIARGLIAKGYKVVLSCAPEERGLASEVLAQTPRLIDGKFSSLGHAMAVVGLARLYVGPDTGTAHFAAAAQVPCVCVFPHSGRPDAWSPYGTGFIAVQANQGQEVRHLPGPLIVEMASELLANPASQRVNLSPPVNYPRPYAFPGVVIHDDRLKSKIPLRAPQSP